MRRRVALVHYTTPTILGGVEQIMRRHAEGLLAAGAEVTIVAGRGGAAPAGVRVARVSEADSRHALVEKHKAVLAAGRVPPDHARLVDRIERRLRTALKGIDRVVVHNVLTMPLNLAFTEALARLAADGAGRFIAWTHDIAAFDPRYDAFAHGGEPWTFISRSLPGVRYITVSNVRARQLAELTGLAREDIGVVTNGVDVGETLGVAPAGARLIERLGLANADPLLLLPVRLTRRKRVEAAIDATAELRRRGRNAMLVVTGAMGPHNAANRAYLAELAERAKGVEGVRLLAAMGIEIDYREVVDLYALADVLVFPSESEGFGIPMLEAGLHQMPIVCSDLPVLRETGGDDAIYVPPDASGSVIADAVERALAMPIMRMRARALGHAWPRVLREQVLPAIFDEAPSDERFGGRGPRSANEVSVREERVHERRRGGEAQPAKRGQGKGPLSSERSERTSARSR